ncbi:MAG: hypothetical protein ABJL11_17655 [Parasphingorhabdus sp.]
MVTVIDTANDGALIKEFDDAKRQEIADGFEATRILTSEVGTFFANRAQEEAQKRAEADRRQAAYDCGCEVGADNKPILVDADGNIVTDGSGVRVPLSAENYATYGGDKTVEGSAAYLNQQARDINETYGSGSATRIIATAFTGAAGSNVVGSLGGLVQSAAVNVLQSLTVNEIKEIADKLGDQEVHPDGTTTYRPNGTSEVIRGLLQGVVGCGGAAAGGSGDCGSAAVGASASAVVNHLINELIGANDGRKEIVRDEDGNIISDRNLEDQEARTNLITSLITAIAVTAGIDPASAANAARIETENNELAGQTFSGTCGSADPGCRAVATADYNLLAKIVGLNEAGLPVDAEGEVINATFVTGEPLDQRFYEDSLEGYQEAQAEARLIVLKALNPGYRTDEEYARYILSSPLRSSGLPGTADPRLDPNTIIQPTDDQITFILAASNFGDLNSPSAVNRVLDYYGGLENIDTGSDPTTLAYNLVEAHNQGKAAFERVGQNALARALVGEGQDSLNSAIAEINRLNDPANADEYKNLSKDERQQLLLAYNYAVNTGQVPRQLSTGERFAPGADGVGNLVVGTALAAGAVLTSEACVSIAGCVIPVGLGAGSAVAFDTAAAQLNGAIDGYEQQTGGGYVATRVFRVDANTGELIYVAAQVSGGLLTGGIVGARNLPRTPGTAGRSVQIDNEKFDYLFGRVTSSPHNTARSQQLKRELARIGVNDTPAGRNIITNHLDEVVADPANITGTFTRTVDGQVLNFETRQSLVSGPGGFLQLNSTFRISADGTRSFITVIPKGGN